MRQSGVEEAWLPDASAQEFACNLESVASSLLTLRLSRQAWIFVSRV